MNQTNEHHKRKCSIDLVRGLAICVMILDHTRLFLLQTQCRPLDLENTSAGLFLTRWITHLAAPAFLFLAGISVGFTEQRKGKWGTSKYLLTRGLWLILLELSIVRLGFTYFNFKVIVLQVMFVIGFSMIILSFLIHFNRFFIISLSLIIIVFHNLLDTTYLPVLHDQFFYQFLPGWQVSILYPIIPWPFVMAIGYGTYILYEKESIFRKKILIMTSLVMVVLFTILRLSNYYGDPLPWKNYESSLFTILSFVNCEKYPPSFLFLLMSLWFPLLLLGLTDQIDLKQNVLVDMGRNPLLLYIIHLYVLRLIKFIIGATTSLPEIYLIAIIVGIISLFLCKLYNKYYNKLKTHPVSIKGLQ